MSTALEIERAIENLPQGELNALREWFEEFTENLASPELESMNLADEELLLEADQREEAMEADSSQEITHDEMIAAFAHRRAS